MGSPRSVLTVPRERGLRHIGPGVTSRWPVAWTRVRIVSPLRILLPCDSFGPPWYGLCPLEVESAVDGERRLRTGAATARPRTIGRLAEEVGGSVETIRFYERRGLLRQPKAPASGWRVYDTSAAWTLHYIRLGRQLGFTLSELKTLLAGVGSRKLFCSRCNRLTSERFGYLKTRSFK